MSTVVRKWRIWLRPWKNNTSSHTRLPRKISTRNSCWENPWSTALKTRVWRLGIGGQLKTLRKKVHYQDSWKELGYSVDVCHARGIHKWAGCEVTPAEWKERDFPMSSYLSSQPTRSLNQVGAGMGWESQVSREREIPSNFWKYFPYSTPQQQKQDSN